MVLPDGGGDVRSSTVSGTGEAHPETSGVPHFDEGVTVEGFFLPGLWVSSFMDEVGLGSADVRFQGLFR